MNWVKRIFRKHPILANSLTYGTMCVGAEFSQQFTNKRVLNKTKEKEPFDWASLGRYTVIGTCINPNMLYFWYKWLDKRYKGTGPKIILRKVLMDQFIMTPPLYVIFYISMSIMERKPNLLEECSAKFLTTFQTSCVFWLPAQTVNFIFVPPAARVVYVGTCSFLWLNILCWLKRKEV